MKSFTLSASLIAMIFLAGCNSTSKNLQANNEEIDEENMVCYTEPKLGSRFVKKECITKEEDAYRRAFAERDAERYERTTATRGGAGTRSGK
ncbi:hypothetical protein ABMY35_20520 [Pseudoalteromonas sp. BZB3]|uniref:Lipoprotein n=1 Tax=Pseudoalteromonas phenolica TaxID=161398 RepID=A0A5R9Q441_9GAMM|nr:hypothetical protein [Pseudoalteromonas phenolica]TLX47019.1 hypothetical protein C1E24_11020 [Pseudoalteromonas phenolica]|tara:strand:+ start:171 stop:446 length:276 start_codon:yes stop_codon:yes gene_type:complete